MILYSGLHTNHKVVYLVFVENGRLRFDDHYNDFTVSDTQESNKLETNITYFPERIIL